MDLSDPILFVISATDYIAFYIKVYDREINDYSRVLRRVNNSNICNNLLNISVSQKKLPVSDEIMEVMLSSRYFMFAKPETICLAAFIFLNKLIVQINNSPLYSSHE